MKYMNLMIVRLLLFFYLSSSYLSATHIHNNAIETHSDCKVCIVVKNLHSGDFPNTQLDNLTCAYDYEPIIFEIQKSTKNILKGFNANAPPFS
jgi:hypothetical protein